MAVLLLAPFAPHMARRTLGATGSYGHCIPRTNGRHHDEEAMKDDEVEIPVQINGKTKAVISIPADISKEDAIAAGKRSTRQTN